MSRQFEEKLKSLFVQLVKSDLNKEEISGEEISILNLAPDKYNLRMDFGRTSIFIPILTKYEIACRLLMNMGFDYAYLSPVKRKERWN